MRNVIKFFSPVVRKQNDNYVCAHGRSIVPIVRGVLLISIGNYRTRSLIKKTNQDPVVNLTIKSALHERLHLSNQTRSGQSMKLHWFLCHFKNYTSCVETTFSILSSQNTILEPFSTNVTCSSSLHRIAQNGK